MAQKKLLLILAVLLAFSLNIRALGAFEFREEDMEFAKKLASMAKQEAMGAIKEKWLKLQKMGSTGKLVLEDGSTSIQTNTEQNTRLRVFVSGSMGLELLKNYTSEAKRYKAILVFNGLPGGSWHKLSDLIYEITGGEAEATSIQLDDNAFSEYGIKTVPSFVLSREVSLFDQENTEQVKKPVFDKINGNIGIRRALEEIKEHGDLSEEASILLGNAGDKK